MRFEPSLTMGKLLRRYKRFFVDVELEDGQIITAHVAATGAMTGCSEPGSRVALSYHDEPHRKLKFSLEMVESNGVWVVVNTALPNSLVEEALRADVIPSLRGYERIRREVKYAQNHRIDVLLESGPAETPRLCYVEVKGVTLCQDGWGYFPDAITERGTRHLLALQEMVRQGHRAVLLFLVLRSDIEGVSPAELVDIQYAQTLREVYANGVEVEVWRLETSPASATIAQSLPFRP